MARAPAAATAAPASSEAACATGRPLTALPLILAEARATAAKTSSHSAQVKRRVERPRSVAVPRRSPAHLRWSEQPHELHVTFSRLLR